MERDRRLSLVVGTFVLGTVAVFAATILSLSSERGFWRPRYRLVTYFENAQGLIRGAPVRVAGKDVGRVEAVDFGPLGEERPPVRVVLQIDRDVQERIRTDSVATIGTIGLLGDKYVEVATGTLEGQVLDDGGTLPAQTPLDLADVMTTGATALDNVAKLAGNLNQVVEDFSVTMGARRIGESAQAFSDIVKEIQEGDGLLHSLVYDRYAGSGVESIEASLATLDDILRQIRHGDGILHTLIYESPTEQDVVMEALEAGARLNSILAKVDRGEGTIGLLLNDPTLYEDMKLLVGGAQRSLLVRSLIRLSTEDGR